MALWPPSRGWDGSDEVFGRGILYYAVSEICVQCLILENFGLFVLLDVGIEQENLKADSEF